MELQNSREHPKKNQTNKQTSKLTSKKKNRQTDRRNLDKPTKYLNTSTKQTYTYLKTRLIAECDVIGPSPPPRGRSSVRPSEKSSNSDPQKTTEIVKTDDKGKSLVQLVYC
jgi:hypothetical protein